MSWATPQQRLRRVAWLVAIAALLLCAPSVAWAQDEDPPSGEDSEAPEGEDADEEPDEPTEGSGKMKKTDPDEDGEEEDGSGKMKKTDEPTKEGSGKMKKTDEPPEEGSGKMKKTDEPTEEGSGKMKKPDSDGDGSKKMAEPETAETTPEPTPVTEPERRTDRPNKVTIYRDEKGFKLQVDGRDFMIFGMNWTYIPIGENYSYSLWTQPEAYIKEALDYEMSKLKAMGVNAIRQYDDIPPKWVTYIYQTYGIYTMVNNTVGRYGTLIDGAFVYPTNYQDERTREILKEQVLESVRKYKDVPGVLFYLLGNENNYGLVWTSFEIENLPGDDDAKTRAKAEYLYSLFGEIADEIKKIDTSKPVAIANGDLGYMDLIAKYGDNIDIMGSNVYRGISSGDLFQRVLDELDKPFVYTEFGADAYNAKEDREDALNQAIYLKGQWQEIYEMSYGKGRVGNAIGGFTFQWSDGWWKYLQEVNLDVHDTTAQWATGAYPADYVEGENNMNEEWFGICAKGPRDKRGFFPLYCRTAYYVLKDACQLDPYAPGTTLETIRKHFGAIDPADYESRYAADQANLRLKALERIRVSQLRIDLETFTTSNSDIEGEGKEKLRFDHLESIYAGIEVRPTENVRGEVVVNVLGNVPTNRIDRIFYENRGESVSVIGADGEEVILDDRDRIQIYQASFEWEEDTFALEGFHRVGHYHWGYEGDFFGLYPEANYQESVDLYNADAPSGLVLTGKEFLDGIKIAAGPELYWGANPAVIAKYYRKFGAPEFALVHQEDIAGQVTLATSSAIAGPPTRRTALFVGYTLGAWKLEWGGLISGTERVGDTFRSAEEEESAPTYLDSGFLILEDEIVFQDTLGTKLRLSYEGGMIKWYGQGGIQGLVADAGVDQRQTYTGWALKATGRGNHFHALSGLALQFGDVLVGPNVLYQQPLEGPLPNIAARYSDETNTFYPGVTPRNILADPFAVRENRETLGLEMMLTYDPTPSTWLWQWDNPDKEDAPLAGSLNFVYRYQPTALDSGLFIDDNGDTLAFGASTPAQDLWDVNLRFIANPDAALRVLGSVYAGRGEPRGNDTRVIYRYGASAKLIYHTLAWDNHVKINDWGPYDFHRDFNLTFPLQINTDLSYGIAVPMIGQYQARFGGLFKLRYLDEHSPPDILLPNPGASFDELGHEWEVGTYVRISL